MVDRTPSPTRSDTSTPRAPAKPGRRLSGYYWPPDAEGMTVEEKGQLAQTPFEPKLETLFQGIFGWTDDDPDHEVKEALDYMNVVKWAQFIRMRDEDIQALTKHSRGDQRVEIGVYSKYQLTVLRQMIRENIKSNVEGARDIETYTLDRFLAYEFEYSEDKRNQASTTSTTVTAPGSANTRGNQSYRQPKSEAEKRLEAWQRLKPDKNDFDILRNDGSYEEWKESFTSVVEVQTFSRVIDPKFNPKALTDPHDIELWNKQQAYMWTVLRRVLRNPLGITCYNDFKGTRDARGAYFAHEELQQESPARMFDTGTLITELKSLHISDKPGNRVQFVSEWFSKMQEFNDITSPTSRLGYHLIRAILLSALNSDNDMTSAFTELKETGKEAVDIENMKRHLLTKAALFDGMDSSSKASTKPRSAFAISAMAHQLGIDDPEVIEFIVNKSRRGPDPSLKLPEDIYSKLDRQDRTQWHGFSDDAKRAIVSGINTTEPAHNPMERKAYTHEANPPWDFTTSSHGATPDDAPSIRDLEDIVVKATSLLTAFKSDASTAPSSISSQSRPPNTSFDMEEGSKKSAKDTKLPLKSSIPISHPARVMADNVHKGEPVVDSNGKFLGFRHASKHEFFTDPDINSDENRIYTVSNRKVRNKTTNAMVDRGANGIVAGADCTWLGGPIVERRVHITGMDNHQVRDIPVGTVGAHVMSNRGPVICIFNEVAYTGRNQTILSAIQMEHYKNKVDDRSIMSGGGQQITTADGFTFPLSIVNGLPFLKMRPYTRTEYKTLPHVIMSSAEEWDPRVFDNEIDPQEADFLAANPPNLHLLPHDDYNVKGEYIGVTNTNVSIAEDIPISPDSFEFWMDDHEYRKHETIARCVHAAQVYNSDPLTHLQVHERNFVTAGDARSHVPNATDYESLKPYFAWIPTKLIKKTFQNSTQYGFMPSSPDGNLFKRWNSPNPALNVFRLQDDLLTDKIHSNTPSIEGSFTEAQIFIGRKSHIIHPEPISKTKTFVKCLQNFVRKWGAPLRLLADHIKYHASFQVLDYLRVLWIGLWFSEAYYQHQNPFERRYQTFKRIVNRTMDRTNTPPELWFLCVQYVAYVLNRVSDPTLNDRQPIFVATGHMGDISALTTFQWFEPVYFKKADSMYSFPDTGESFGHFVGIAEHVGHAMTYRIWKPDTNKIVERSAVRSARDTQHENQRALLPDSSIEPPSTPADDGEQPTGRPPGLEERPTDFIFNITDKSSSPTHITTPDSKQYGESAYLHDTASLDDTQSDTPTQPQPTVAEDGSIMVVLLDEDGHPKLDSEGNAIMIPGKPHDKVQGKTFKKHMDDGTVRRARVLGPATEDTKHTDSKGRQILHDFKIKYDSIDVEEIMTYNDVMNYLHRADIEENGELWNFRRILAHRGPLGHRDPLYKNSKYNVRVEWETGEITEEPLNKMIVDSPIPLAEYALKNKLLDQDGWRSLNRIVKRKKKYQRLVKQAKLRSFRTSPKYMYGFQVPRDYEEAMELDRKNGNTKWADSMKLEMLQLDEYNTFIDRGMYHSSKIPTGFKRIRVHLVFAVKHDGRHKSRLVADGHLTDTPLDSVYAGVVSIRGLRMVLFLAELNGLDAYATDIGNAYLEATTQEKVCIKAGPEFGEHRDGHLLIIHKALYGLRSSGKQFGDLLALCLKDLGFSPSLAEPQIFMRESDGLYEYVATYVDDLCFVVRNPEQFLTQLQSDPYNFKLKGSGPMSFHLGCGFERDAHGVLCMNPRKFIDKMNQSYEQMFGAKPGTKPMSPLPEGDHPELDTTELLSDEDTQKYQSLIGSLQWLITLGRWDIQTAVMSLSSFRAMPRAGHLNRVKRIYAYVNRFKHFVIRFRTEEPDLSELDRAVQLDWDKSVYGQFEEELPIDAPKPLGKKVTLVHWFDANLMHDVLSGKAVTGCIHFVNKTPIMWYSKKQATSETATYGAEFVAGRTCIEQMVDLRQTFRYLGVPVHHISYMFGDNESMINTSTYTYAKLNKRHNILSYHYVRSMIARGFISLTHTPSGANLADVVTKHWSHNSVYGLLRPVFHHMGNTADLYADDDHTPTNSTR